MTLRSLKRAACAALLLTAAPVWAAASPGTDDRPFGRSTPAGAVATDPDISAFYQRRANQPVWLTDAGRPATAELIAMLKRAELDGFASGPALAADAERAIASASTGDRAAVLAADQKLTSAWVRYVAALRAPAAGMTYADPTLVPQAPTPQRILAGLAAAPSLTQYVSASTAVSPVYAALRDAAWADAQANGGVDARVRANLERARALPATGRHVLVDAAAQRLYMIDGGRILDTMKVVVGKPDSQTPMLASKIHFATLNPYWNVPTDLARKLIAPRVLADGVSYLKQKHYEVLSSFDDNATLVDPATVDWKAVADGTTELRVRQEPGGGNAMGDIKLFFVNSLGIFLHDTPDKALFGKDVRTFSNGCVRLEDAHRLARWVMGSDPQATGSQPEQHIRLNQAVPLYITYLTAQADGGRLTLLDDVYGRDGAASRMAGSGVTVTAR